MKAGLHGLNRASDRGEHNAPASTRALSCGYRWATSCSEVALTLLRLKVTGGASSSGGALQVTAKLARTGLMTHGEVTTRDLPIRKGVRMQQLSAIQQTRAEMPQSAFVSAPIGI